MFLDLSVNTELEDLIIDFIEVRLGTGEVVSLNWDESEIERTDAGFEARYCGVYFGEEYANGRMSELTDMVISTIGIYIDHALEHDFNSEISITGMTFYDNDDVFSPDSALPYTVNISECERT